MPVVCSSEYRCETMQLAGWKHRLRMNHFEYGVTDKV